jgi:hypothetical protein
VLSLPAYLSVLGHARRRTGGRFRTRHGPGTADVPDRSVGRGPRTPAPSCPSGTGAAARAGQPRCRTRARGNHTLERPSWTAPPSTRKTAAKGPPVALWIRHPRAVQEAPSSCSGHDRITRPGIRVRPPPLKIEKTTASKGNGPVSHAVVTDGDCGAGGNRIFESAAQQQKFPARWLWRRPAWQSPVLDGPPRTIPTRGVAIFKRRGQSAGNQLGNTTVTDRAQPRRSVTTECETGPLQ